MSINDLLATEDFGPQFQLDYLTVPYSYFDAVNVELTKNTNSKCSENQARQIVLISR